MRRFLPADIDECLDASVCVGGQCVNTDGSYMCFCTHPMVLEPNGNHCVYGPEVAGKKEKTVFCFNQILNVLLKLDCPFCNSSGSFFLYSQGSMRKISLTP